MVRCSGGAPHDIALLKDLGELVPVDRGDAVGLGQVLCALTAAVDDYDVMRTRTLEGGHREGVHRAGTDDDVTQSGGIADAVGHARESGLDEPGAHVVEVGVGVRVLGDTEGARSKRDERSAGASGVLARLEGRAQLTEDLRLADGDRLETAGDGEQVRHRGVVVTNDGGRGELVHVDAARPRHCAQERVDAGVERRHIGVELESVARGQYENAGHGRL